MTLKRYTASAFETVPFRYYDGTNWRGAPLYRYNGSEWVDAYLNDGLRVYYPFDGDVQDYSGNSNDGTDNTSAGYGNARIGSDSKDFDGNDDGVTLSNFSFDIAGSAGFTMSFWIRPNFGSADGSGYNIVEWFPDSNNNFVLAWRPSNNDWHYGWSNSNDFLDFNHSSGEWYHIAVTVTDNGSYTGYWDGSDVTQRSVDSAVGTGDLTIGFSGASSDSYWDGLIDSVRFYNRALTTSEINQLYQQGRVI